MLVMEEGTVVAVAVKLGVVVRDTGESVAVAESVVNETLASAETLTVLAAVTEGDAPVVSEAVAVCVAVAAALALRVALLVIDADTPNEWLAVGVSDRVS